MSDDKKLCHGQFEALTSCSESVNLNVACRCLWRLKNFVCHTLWHLKTKGPVKTLEHTQSKVLKLICVGKKDKPCSQVGKGEPAYEERLGLKPGELVEVKSESEIRATLDEKARNRGMLWMPNMRKFCGKRYRVYKRLERILLESNGEHRNVKDTVLLEGVLCDGEEWFGCDRSCFHYWKEAWLKRVE